MPNLRLEPLTMLIVLRSSVMMREVKAMVITSMMLILKIITVRIMMAAPWKIAFQTIFMKLRTLVGTPF